jgi:AraC family transcriptional regulator
VRLQRVSTTARYFSHKTVRVSLVRTPVGGIQRREPFGEWDTNQDAAHASIARAFCLLRGEIDRPRASARQNGMRSGLLGWQVRRVRDYIEAHMGAQIRVSDLSALVQRSEAHFARAFKRSFGQTPHSYLVGRRLAQATRLMLASDTSISDIAAACGFSDQAHLCNRFRRRYGKSPAAWRREKSARRDGGTAMEISPKHHNDLDRFLSDTCVGYGGPALVALIGLSGE